MRVATSIASRLSVSILSLARLRKGNEFLNVWCTFLYHSFSTVCRFGSPFARRNVSAQETTRVQNVTSRGR